jgi:hypothetical protein
MAIGMNLDEVTKLNLRVGLFFVAIFLNHKAHEGFAKGAEKPLSSLFLNLIFRIKLLDLEGFEHTVFLSHYKSAGFNPRWLSG